MALQLIDTVAPCFDYEAYVGNPRGYYVYALELISPPRHYVESLISPKQFFYDPVEDVYVAYATLDYAFWPSWRMYRLVWNGADGSLNEEYTDNSNIFFAHWTNHISVGGYDKFYATGNSFLDVKEISWKANTWSGWTCFDWAGRTPPVFHQAIVNRKDKIVVGNSLSSVFYIFNYETHALLGKIGSLYTTNRGYMSYESDTHFWVAYSTGQLAKINYSTRRHEMLSCVVSPDPEDISYRCAFDTSRKRLAILRHKPDAADGACRLQLEFYQPVPQASVITAPVPVHSLAAGERINFSAHVLGDAGEGIASQAVAATLALPAAGQLVTGRLTTGLNGSVNITYQAPDDNAAETLTVSTEV